ncbi:hypothetical protein [Longitalea luteola]|uniref:hypothetical protein n=1 Tax=Longitalea luteola TaxID=2812563 RepID=UPI001A968B8E|nr:hypothetical protein [Longitalea luteola]
MATNIKHTLKNLEVTPPPGVWPDIAARLNAEFDADEISVAKKLTDLAVTPPQDLWSGIAAQLNTPLEADEVSVAKKMQDISIAPPFDTWEKIAAHLPQQPAKKEGRVIALHSRKAIVAAAALVLLTVGAWYFLDRTNTVDTPPAVAKSTRSSTTAKGSAAQNRTPAADTEIGEIPVPRVQRLNEKQLAALSDANASIISKRYRNRHGARRTAFYDYQPIATSYAGMDDVQAVEFTEINPPDVEAPLIRDANGQVILDKKLITSPDNCYITVTSPNGEQTRISSKFLHIINTINQDVEQQDYFDFMMQENSLWKIRFNEWKEKFLNQTSFVPTPTSFTDILELKDLLMAEE